MTELLARLIGIVLLRMGPQDLPASTLAFGLAVGLYGIVAALSIFTTGTPPERPIVSLVLYLLLPATLIWVVLRIAGRLGRFGQTATALYGVGALLAALNLPLIVIGTEDAPAPAVVLALLIFFWHFAVDAHIWRHALEVTYTAGLAVTVVLFAVSLFVIVNLGGMA